MYRGSLHYADFWYFALHNILVSGTVLKTQLTQKIPYFKCKKELCTLQMFTGIYRVPVGFFCNIYVRITDKPYTPQRERLCML